MLGYELGNFAFGVIQIPENTCVCNARLHAERLLVFGYAVFAERTFRHNAIHGVHRGGIIGAHPAAIAAPNANALVYQNKPGAFVFVHSTRGAVLNASRVFTVVAKHRAKRKIALRIGAYRLIKCVTG